MHYRLRVVEGLSTSSAFDMDERFGLTIGRSPLNDIQVLDPDVSRTHALVMPNRNGNGGCLLFDMQSTNGTFVEQQGVRSSHLAPGARFRVGSTTLCVETVSADALTDDHISTTDAHISTVELTERELASRPA